MTMAGDALANIFDVRDARVLVTGAASGLGLAMAEAMVEAGARVTLTDVDEAGLAHAVERLSGLAGTAEGALLDIGDYDAIRETVARIVREQGGIDVVFANAAGGGGPAEEDGVVAALGASWFSEMNVHLGGTVATVQAAARAMVDQGSGSIVITSSTSGLKGDSHVPYSYATIKGAMINFGRQAALELAPYGVRVNVIAPGPFRTNIAAKAAAAGYTTTDEEWARTVALGRTADPAELKGLALLLGSSAGSFITGGVHVIDGGSLLMTAG
jgi:NAD(P)-dependent dehydrogenase (short-subunit alcohol dehydrogenase family)